MQQKLRGRNKGRAWSRQCGTGWLTVGEIGEVLGEDAAVPVLLQGGQLHTHYLLLLRRQLLQHVLLQPSQQMWGQQLMQLGNLHAPSHLLSALGAAATADSV